jgi:hypothetical protein
MQIRVHGMFGMLVSSEVVSASDLSDQRVWRVAAALSEHRFAKFGVCAQAMYQLCFLGELSKRPLDAIEASNRVLDELASHGEYSWTKSPDGVTEYRLDFVKLVVREISVLCDPAERVTQIALLANWLTFSNDVSALTVAEVILIVRGAVADGV